MKTDFLEPQTSHAARGFPRQIWLAGLGAFARTQEESGRFFEVLVEEGRMVDRRLKKTDGQPTEPEVEPMPGGIEVLKGRAGVIRDQATGTWNKLELVFQARVTRALSQLGVPTQEDVRLLRQQVDRLTENIQVLTRAAESATRQERAGDAAESPVVVRD
ncbi:MAG: phasin family protein [Candidatus Competibacteraceae bacterium]